MSCIVIIYLIIGFICGAYLAITSDESIIEAFLLFLIGVIGWPGMILWILLDR